MRNTVVVALIVFFSVATFCQAKICNSKGPMNPLCRGDNPVEGCLCITRNVCATAKADPCSVCPLYNVYSFEPGKTCGPTIDLTFCRPNDRVGSCFLSRTPPVDGCLCTAPGVCQKAKTNRCTACKDPKVFSFTPGSNC